MRSNLSKSLKINSGESGCLKGRGAKEEHAVYCVDAGGDAANTKAVTTHQ